MTDWNETIQAMNKTDELLTEITRLREEVDNGKVVLKTLYAEITRLRTRLDEAEKVIKPFAEKCVSRGHNLPRYDLQAQLTYDYRLKMNDLRAAAKWMEGKS